MGQEKHKKKRAGAIMFPESYKRQVIEEYLRTGICKIKIQNKYGIKFKSAIITWMKKLGYDDPYRKSPELCFEKHSNLLKKKRSKDISATNQEVALLKRQLEDEQLRAAMYNQMIDIAEKEYKISIRKNSNTK